MTLLFLTNALKRCQALLLEVSVLLSATQEISGAQVERAREALEGCMVEVESYPVLRQKLAGLVRRLREIEGDRRATRHSGRQDGCVVKSAEDYLARLMISDLLNVALRDAKMEVARLLGQGVVN